MSDRALESALLARAAREEVVFGTDLAPATDTRSPAP
jgi:hypothetical protein